MRSWTFPLQVSDFRWNNEQTGIYLLSPFTSQMYHRGKDDDSGPMNCPTWGWVLRPTQRPVNIVSLVPHPSQRQATDFKGLEQCYNLRVETDEQSMRNPPGHWSLSLWIHTARFWCSNCFQVFSFDWSGFELLQNKIQRIPRRTIYPANGAVHKPKSLLDVSCFSFYQSASTSSLSVSPASIKS